MQRAHVIVTIANDISHPAPLLLHKSTGERCQIQAEFREKLTRLEGEVKISRHVKRYFFKRPLVIIWKKKNQTGVDHTGHKSFLSQDLSAPYIGIKKKPYKPASAPNLL